MTGADNIMRYMLASIIMLCLMTSIAFAADTYFSTSGDDSGAGTIGDPYKTIAKLNTISCSAGDNVFLNRGDTWRVPEEGLYVEPNDDCIYDAYGTGDKPQIFGSNTTVGTGNWTDTGGNVWAHVYNHAREIANIVDTDTELAFVRNWSLTDMQTQGQGSFYWDSGNDTLYVYSTSNPYTYYGSLELVVGRQLIYSYNTQRITIQNWDIRYGGYNAIDFQNLEDSVITNNNIQMIGGAYFSGSGDSTVRFGNGIQFWGDTTNITVEYNNLTKIFDAALTNQYDGISEVTQQDIIYRNNIVTNSAYCFEQFLNYQGGTLVHGYDILFQHNTCYNMGYGWYTGQRYQSVGTAFYRNGRDEATDANKNYTIKDNIFANIQHGDINCAGGIGCGYYVNLGTLLNGYDSPENYTIDYNLIYNTIAGRFAEWGATGSTVVSSFVNWQAYDMDLNSVNSNPIFIDDANNDFRPADGSPACGSASDGTDIGALPCSVEAPTEYLIINSVDVTPDPLVSGEDAVCKLIVYFSGADVNGTYTWYLNDTAVENGTLPTMVTGVQKTVATLDSDSYNISNDVTCEINVYQGALSDIGSDTVTATGEYRYFVLQDSVTSENLTNFTVTYDDIIYISDGETVTIPTTILGVDTYEVLAEKDGYIDVTEDVTFSDYNDTYVYLNATVATITIQYTESSEGYFDTYNCVETYDCSYFNDTSITINVTELSEGYVTFRFNPDGSENWQQVFSFYNDLQTKINETLLIETVDLTQEIRPTVGNSPLSDVRVCSQKLAVHPDTSTEQWITTYCDYSDSRGNALLLLNDENNYKICAQKEGYSTICNLYFIPPANTVAFVIAMSLTGADEGFTHITTTCAPVYNEDESCTLTVTTSSLSSEICMELYREDVLYKTLCGYATAEKEFIYNMYITRANYSVYVYKDSDLISSIYHKFLAYNPTVDISFDLPDQNGDTILEKIRADITYYIVFMVIMAMFAILTGWMVEKYFEGYGIYGSGMFMVILGSMGFYLFFVPALPIVLRAMGDIIFPMLK